MHLRIQIPARNEATTLAGTVGGAMRRVGPLLTADDVLSVVIVDDASTDATAAVCAALGARDARVRALRLERSRGLGVAFRAGLADAVSADVDVLVHLDGDGQHDDADLASMLDPVLGGAADLVLGSRFAGDAPAPVGLGRLAKAGNWALSRAVSAASGRRFADVSCGLRVFGPRALRAMQQLRADYTYTHESVLLAAAADLRIVEVGVVVAGRRAFGRSRLVRGPIRHALRCAAIIVDTRRRVRAVAASAALTDARARAT